ncbi:hypothetical protein FT641_18920 [Bacillus paranthracis]|uniref:hypothetical protein n=1 Tax=Bacillus paranthracis TaxID=2026186 RepID=UPI00187A0C67|nr:hypothetical protein [Bacillus paranthracis]MBE7114362.1 hypothetical protein [Bacillus paranthracis]MBE7154765.1 hypothetical protein [Bacillus paranthracis]
MTEDMIKVVDEGLALESAKRGEELTKYLVEGKVESKEKAERHQGRYLAYHEVNSLRMKGRQDELWKWLHIWKQRAKKYIRWYKRDENFDALAVHEGMLEVFTELQNMFIQSGKVQASIVEIRTVAGQNMYYLEDGIGKRFKKRGYEIKMLGDAASKLPAGVSPAEAAIGREVLILK